MSIVNTFVCNKTSSKNVVIIGHHIKKKLLCRFRAGDRMLHKQQARRQGGFEGVCSNSPKDFIYI